MGKKEKRETGEVTAVNADLEKGWKEAATGVAMASALASAAIPRGDRDQEAKKLPVHPKVELNHELLPIAAIESSSGKNKNHAVTKVGLNRGHQAGGATGLMPITVKETIKRNPALAGKYAHLADSPHAEITSHLNSNPDFEAEVANTHWARLHRVFPGDPARRAYAWRNGITAARMASRDEVHSHPYVQKFLKLQNQPIADLKKTITMGHQAGVGAPSTLTGGAALSSDSVNAESLKISKTKKSKRGTAIMRRSNSGKSGKIKSQTRGSKDGLQKSKKPSDSPQRGDGKTVSSRVQGKERASLSKGSGEVLHRNEPGRISSDVRPGGNGRLGSDRSGATVSSSQRTGAGSGSSQSARAAAQSDLPRSSKALSKSSVKRGSKEVHGSGDSQRRGSGARPSKSGHDLRKDDAGRVSRALSKGKRPGASSASGGRASKTVSASRDFTRLEKATQAAKARLISVIERAYELLEKSKYWGEQNQAPKHVGDLHPDGERIGAINPRTKVLGWALKKERSAEKDLDHDTRAPSYTKKFKGHAQKSVDFLLNHIRNHECRHFTMASDDLKTNDPTPRARHILHLMNGTKNDEGKLKSNIRELGNGIMVLSCERHGKKNQGDKARWDHWYVHHQGGLQFAQSTENEDFDFAEKQNMVKEGNNLKKTYSEIDLAALEEIEQLAKIEKMLGIED